MASRTVLVVLSAVFLVADSASVKVLQGPGSRTTLYGPDGSALKSVAPGGTVITDRNGAAGLVAAGPALLPVSPEVVIGGGLAGKIVTSYTAAGPALVAAVAPETAAIVAGPALSFGTVARSYDDGSYKPGKY